MNSSLDPINVWFDQWSVSEVRLHVPSYSQYMGTLSDTSLIIVYWTTFVPIDQYISSCSDLWRKYWFPIRHPVHPRSVICFSYHYEHAVYFHKFVSQIISEVFTVQCRNNCIEEIIRKKWESLVILTLFKYWLLWYLSNHSKFLVITDLLATDSFWLKTYELLLRTVSEDSKLEMSVFLSCLMISYIKFYYRWKLS